MSDASLKPKEQSITIEIDTSKPPVSVEELDKGRVFLIRHLFSASECKQIIEQSETIGFDKLPKYVRAHRGNDRLMLDQTDQLQQIIYQRLHDVLPNTMNVEEIASRDAESSRLGFIADSSLARLGVDERGSWRISGLNPRMRFCRYYPGDRFAPHYDGNYVDSVDTRSFLTVNIYLNNEFTGGDTNFLAAFYDRIEDRVITHRVRPETGMALVFLHPLLHEGDAVVDGVKYLMRTDVLYTRCEPLANDNDAKALALYRLAEQKEASGEHDQAAKLYRSAFKLSPLLEQSFS